MDESFDSFQLVFIQYDVNENKKNTRKIIQTLKSFEALKQQLRKIATMNNVNVLSIGRCIVKPLTNTQKKILGEILITEKWQTDAQ